MLEKKIRNTALISVLILILSLLPIIALSGVNRATGDDYGYAIHTRAAWTATHSLIEVGRAVCRTVREFYGGWQGTWFSIALFSLQPEVFHDDAYVIVAVLMLFLWIGSTFCLFRQILCREMGLDGWSCLLVTAWFMLVGIEFIPSTRSSIFWFNGCAHYMIPFAMCQMLTAWLLRYRAEYKKRTFAGIFVFMALLGGANYQAALFALIVAGYTLIGTWIITKDKRIFTLCIPMTAELIGLVVSMMSPGNTSRAGEEFGFSIGKAVKTIGCSFLYGITDIGGYIEERPLALVGMILLFAIFFMIFRLQREAFRLRYPIWFVLMLFCLYSAMQSPAIYADVSVSGGVPNMNYQVFLLTAAGILMIAAGKLADRSRQKRGNVSEGQVLRTIGVPCLLLCVVLAFFCRGNVKESTSYESLVYMTSGQAGDYREQMDLQTSLMEADGVSDVVVPGINDVQGPLMHMPVTDDADAWTNTVTAGFYGKHSVVAMERSEWMELYGD